MNINMIKNRFSATLAGSAVGDAVGAPLEFIPPERIIHIFGGPVKDMIAHPNIEYRKPGVCTDDTEMAILITKSIIEREKIDMKDISEKFCDWYIANLPDIGGTTLRALYYLCDHDICWEESGKRAWLESGKQAAGNGSLMRTHPVALYDFEFDTFEEDVWKLSLITHYDPRCVESCIVASRLIGHLIKGEKDVLDEITRDVSNVVRKAVLEAPYMEEKNLDRSGYVVSTLQNAIWALYTTKSFEDALVKAVNLGGDADTYGAVCGAFAGALYGLESIQQRWQIVKVFHMSWKDIVKLGENFFMVWQLRLVKN